MGVVGGYKDSDSVGPQLGGWAAFKIREVAARGKGKREGAWPRLGAPGSSLCPSHTALVVHCVLCGDKYDCL